MVSSADDAILVRFKNKIEEYGPERRTAPAQETETLERVSAQMKTDRESVRTLERQESGEFRPLVCALCGLKLMESPHHRELHRLICTSSRSGQNLKAKGSY